MATTTASVLPLTTTFTQPPGCGSLILRSCGDSSACTAVLPETICPLGTGIINDIGGPGCFPSMITDSNGAANGHRVTYSPGRICPIGMTTAASAISPDGVWCCPSGLTWASSAPLCATTLTEGVFISPTQGTEHCNTAGVTFTLGAAGGTQVIVTSSLSSLSTLSDGRPTAYIDITIAVSTMVLTAFGEGIFLAGQTMAREAAPTGLVTLVTGGNSTHSSPTNSASTSIPAGNGQSGSLQQEPSSSSNITGIVAGIIVGGIVAGTGLGLLLISWRKRSRRDRDLAHGRTKSVEVHCARDYLHGTGKAELDASAGATRNELEGSSVENRDSGAGIYVQKPELEGTPGTSGVGGDVYVLSKAELEARQRKERKHLWAVVRRFPFAPEYTKIQKLNAALLQSNERPPTPPSYVPSGWTVDQARGFDLNLVTKLSEEEHRLWAAGKTADDVRRAQKRNQLPTNPPGFIPAGWTTEQAICPGFELLSQLSKPDLTRFMEARNQANQNSSAATSAPQKVAIAPSPLVQTLQRAGFPPWGYVIVRTYYRSESQWEQFQEKLDAMCDEQLSAETGKGLDKVQETLEFKMIEDPRLQDVSAEEARRHFHVAKAMGGVAAGLDLNVLLLVDEGVIDSVLNDDANNRVPYLTAVDVTEAGESGGYPGRFKVSIDSLLCELYPKLSMGLSPRSLWSMMDDGNGIWTGDDE
ncbi:Checkpoint protein hus1 [Hypoxylon texense]